MSQLAEDARALIAGVAGEKVRESRQCLTAALERGNEIYGRVREKAVEGAKATDPTIREHPYEALGIAVGAGALIGYFLSRRCSRNGD